MCRFYAEGLAKFSTSTACGGPFIRVSAILFLGKDIYIGGRNDPAALYAHNIVTSVPLSELVILPSLRFPFVVITLFGVCTVLSPV